MGGKAWRAFLRDKSEISCFCCCSMAVAVAVAVAEAKSFVALVFLSLLGVSASLGGK